MTQRFGPFKTAYLASIGCLNEVASHHFAGVYQPLLATYGVHRGLSLPCERNVSSVMGCVGQTQHKTPDTYRPVPIGVELCRSTISVQQEFAMLMAMYYSYYCLVMYLTTKETKEKLLQGD